MSHHPSGLTILPLATIKQHVLFRLEHAKKHEAGPVFFGVLSASIGDFADLSGVDVVDGENLRFAKRRAEDLFKRVMTREGRSLVICYPSGSGTYRMTGDKFSSTYPLASNLPAVRTIWMTTSDRRSIEPGTLLSQQEDDAVDKMARAMDPESWGEYDDGNGRCSNGAGYACTQSIRQAQRLIRSYPAILDIINPAAFSSGKPESAHE